MKIETIENIFNFLEDKEQRKKTPTLMIGGF